MNSPEHISRIALVLAWSGWLAYICFKRAVKPPKHKIPGGGTTKLRHSIIQPIVRVLIALCGLLVLVIGLGVALSK